MIKNIPKKTYWTLGVIIALFVVSVIVRFVVRPAQLPAIVHCSDFRTQAQAQKTFVTDTARYRSLDGNHDGKACNGLPL